MFQYCCKLWFPRERHQKAPSSCHSLLRTESPARQCHDLTLQASVSTHNQLHSVSYTVWTWSPASNEHVYFGQNKHIKCTCCVNNFSLPKRKKLQKEWIYTHTHTHTHTHTERERAILAVVLCVTSDALHISIYKKVKISKFIKETVKLFKTVSQWVCLSRSDQFWMTSVSAEVSIPNS